MNNFNEETFIEKHSDKVDWGYISQYQKLSEVFIEKHSDKVYWGYISQYQKLSKSFIEKHNLKIPEDNWLYVSDEEKEEYIRNNTNYEIKDVKDGCVIAYKSVRDGGYSVYNFQYQYEVGKTYVSHSDHNLLDENSFGLSSWTKEGALKYYNQGKLFKVSIPISKLSAVVHDGHKIRSSELTVLEEVTETVL